MTSFGLPSVNAESDTIARGDAQATRRASARVLTLPPYDVRVRRELAHRRFYWSLTRHFFRVVGLHLMDAAAVSLAVIVAWGILGGPSVQPFASLLVVIVLIGLNVSGAYRAGAARRDLKRIGQAVLLSVLVLGVVRLLLANTALPFETLGVFSVAAALLLAAERLAVELVVRQAYARGIGLRKAVIVGRQSEVDEIIGGLRTDQNLDQRVAGYVTPSHVRDQNALGSVDQIEAILDQQDPAELIIASSLGSDVLRFTADACFKRGVRVLVVPMWSRALRGWAEPVTVGRMSGYHVHPHRLGVPALALKRATDVALTVTALTAALPLMALVAAAIKLDSRGQVFFRQRRVGLGGREFMMWKFRSMLPEAEAEQASVAHLNPYPDRRLFKLRDDPRVTRVGRVLRRFSLDELPQLFNVLAGDMSLVGPRPPLPTEVARYEARHFVRLSVVPGLTGPWQVAGRNLIVDFEEIVRMERHYVDTWSLGLDLAIMAKTIGVVLSGKGAY